MVKFMYLFKRGLLPSFRDMFTLGSQIHSHNTRNSSFFYIPHCRRKFSIRFQGPKFFNSLSREIQNSESIFSLFDERLIKKVPSFVVKYTLCWATNHFFFPFLFFTSKKLIHISFSTLHSHDLPHSSRKPIVYKPPPSIQASLSLYHGHLKHLIL